MRCGAKGWPLERIVSRETQPEFSQPPVSDWPQLAQKRAADETAVPQAGQNPAGFGPSDDVLAVEAAPPIALSSASGATGRPANWFIAPSAAIFSTSRRDVGMSTLL